jgi:uroporphyrinogen decarboxylase
MNDSPTSRFVDACRRKPVDCTPVWFMRQAGRYQPEYRALRTKHSILDLCRTPELAAEVTMLPVTQMDLDAAIIFGDLMLPLPGLGVGFDIVENVGPVIDEPLRTEEQIRGLRKLEPARDVGFLLEALKLVRRELNGRIPLIGFGGAPFTLAAYMVEGKGSRDYRETKTMMFSRPDLFAMLMDHLAGEMAVYLRAQVEAGAEVIQVFDSWVGCLGRNEYAQHVLPHMKKLFAGLEGLTVPVIHFGTGNAPFLDLVASAGGDVIGVDWRTPMDIAWGQIGADRAVQGNLDPTILLADMAANRPGHIFNLGHGVLPGTPVDNVRRLADHVHEASAR